MVTCGNEDAHERDEDFCDRMAGDDGHWKEITEGTEEEEEDGSEEDIAVKAIVQMHFIRPGSTFWWKYVLVECTTMCDKKNGAI